MKGVKDTERQERQSEEVGDNKFRSKIGADPLELAKSGSKFFVDTTLNIDRHRLCLHPYVRDTLILKTSRQDSEPSAT